MIGNIYDTDDLEELYDVMYEYAVSLPKELINIIVYSYLDNRIRCYLCKKMDYDFEECKECEEYFCESKCAPKLKTMGWFQYCTECYDTTSDLITCDICDSRNLAEDGDCFTCDGCHDNICYDCQLPNQNTIRCHNNNCHMCRIGKYSECDDNYIEAERYCNECFPVYRRIISCTICNLSDSDNYIYLCDGCNKWYCKVCNEEHVKYSNDDSVLKNIMNIYCNDCNSLNNGIHTIYS